MNLSSIDWSAVVVALIAGGFLSEVIRIFVNKGKPKAELNDLFAATAERLVKASNEHFDELQEQINELKAEITKKDIEAETMSNEIDALRTANQAKDEKIEKLEKDYMQLKTQYEELKRRYDVLELQYQELNTDGC